jgi:hypothetical protein
MFQKIPATPRCAAHCSRIDLRPSRGAAALWLAWLTLVCGTTLFAVALPWLVRVAVCAVVAIPGFRCVRSFVLLEGPRALRAIEWSDEGEFVVFLGPALRPQSASLGAGSFRFGLQLWVLRFMTPLGPRSVLIAGGVQEPRAFRRLCRCLSGRLRRASGRANRTAVTIRPKV